MHLRRSATLARPPGGDAAARLPIHFRARELRGRLDAETIAQGDVELRRGGLVIRADSLSYQSVEDIARAVGNVSVSADGNRYSGPEFELRLGRFEGHFNEPRYHFGRTGAGGKARRIDFLDERRTVATDATYTSCTIDGEGTPAWLLTSERVNLDFEADEGVAVNAVLRFYDVPLLGLPMLSFPLSNARKSGWLPPTVNLDNRSGLQMAVPYYWNIAPNRDATLTPTYSSRRGAGIDAEFRYLEPGHGGKLNLDLLPKDNVAGRSRHALHAEHDGELPFDVRLRFRGLRVSDDDYWKDFPRRLPSLTPRLLGSELQLQQSHSPWTNYVRVQGWQVLQDPASRIEAPYERMPQIGTRYTYRDALGFDVALEAELNRFANPVDAATAPRPTGVRAHLLGSVGRPFAEPGWTLTPRVSFNSAAYALDQPLADGRRRAARTIPTLSLDSNWLLERDTQWFGRPGRQTLEPRLLYVYTPYRDQSGLPNFDAAGKDFNVDSVYSENSFAGVDRVSDAHQLTAGVTTRLYDASRGAELLRLGLVQRHLFRDQRVTPDGTVFTRKSSDVLVLGSTSVVPGWQFNASVQYSPESQRTERSVASARYSPGPFRSVGATYRLARGLSEQVELAWQWPIIRGATRRAAAAATGGACKSDWYSVGRVNYSKTDGRVTDSLIGLEYDGGCWIGRVVAERLSTGRSEATTRLSVQLELVGLSRLNLGSNPLRVLKDNIPGYQLLREDGEAPVPSNHAHD